MSKKDEEIEEVTQVEQPELEMDKDQQATEPETTDQPIPVDTEALVVLTDREKFLIEKCVRYFYGPEKNQGASDHELRVLVAKLVTIMQRGEVPGE